MTVVRQTVQYRIGGEVNPFSILLDTAQTTQNYLNRFISNSRVYEPETTRFVAATVRKGDAVIDVGAHVGFFSLFAASLVGAGGRVVAFEPEPGNFAALGRNRDENGFTQIRACNAAVSDRPGTLTFWVNQDNDGGHALWNVGEHTFNVRSKADPRPIEVEATTLDTCAGDLDLDRIKLVKIDAEGAEPAVLKGARTLLSGQRIDFLIAEINEFGLERMGSSQADLRSWMKSLGYETFKLHEDGSLPKLIPDGVTVVSQGVFNLLFTRPERLAPYFPVETT